MEQNTLLKIARLRSLAAKQGKAFDVVRFAGDRSFASRTLSELMNTTDEQLLLAGLEVMSALKMTAEPDKAAPAASTPKNPPAAPAAETGEKYVGRLR